MIFTRLLVALFLLFSFSCNSGDNHLVIYNALTPGILSPVAETENSIRNNFDAVIVNDRSYIDSVLQSIRHLSLKDCGANCYFGEPVLICDISKGYLKPSTVLYDQFTFSIEGEYYCADTNLVKTLFRLSKGPMISSFGYDEYCE